MEKTHTSDVVSLLQNIQHHMSKKLSTEQKLFEMMKDISVFFEASSCVTYLSIDDNYLEFFSGFNFEPKEDERTIRFGEGLIGEITSQSNILSQTNMDASNQSVIGAPLVLWDKVIGVLILNFAQKHSFSNQELENLKTTAMFLTSILSLEEISLYKRQFAKSRGINLKDRLKGTSLNKGYGVGSAVVHQRRKAVQNMFTDDIKSELSHLDTARADMIDDFNQTLKLEKNNIGEHTEIIETYKMLAEDKGWHKKIRAHIETGLSAEAAVEKTCEEMQEKLLASPDIYLKERAEDLRYISDRLRSYLNGQARGSCPLYQDIVLIAQTMGPADFMDYDYKRIRALILEDGTSTMHVAIVAKALNIPVITKLKGIYNDVKDGEILAVDGMEGYVYINPTLEMRQKFFSKQQKMSEWRHELKAISEKKSQTKDRVKINLGLNLGLDFDLEYIAPSNCDEIGLYRTEIAFMASNSLPTIKEQTLIYKKVLDKARGKPVIFRSLDVGSDKLLPYWGKMEEENPAIGWRSIRITLDRRALLRSQMRAFLEAAAGQELYVMFPMISSFHEFMEAKETLLLEYQKQKALNAPVPFKLHIGLMIEVPSVIFELDEILKGADFISIGTNDLAQFIFACDRTNPRLFNRYDVLSAPFLNVLKTIKEKADANHVLCSVCGEMASVPVEAMALIGLGFKHFSSSGSAFAHIKKMVRSVCVKELSDYINTLLKSDRQTLRPQLISYAHDHGIAI